MAFLRIPLALAAALALAGVQPSRAEEGFTTFPDPSRLIAVGGSVTEIVYALGEEGRLIGRDSTGLYPEAALKLPDVGYMRALSPENVLALNPSGILTLEGSGPKEAVDVLKKARVPFIMVSETFDEAGILKKIESVGRAIGVEAKAQALAGQVKADIDAAQALTAGIAERKRVLFVLSMQGGKILASGTATAADGIIAMAGGRNVLTEFQGYKQMSDEAVIVAAPDVVLMMDRGGDHGAADSDLFAHPAIASTPAGKAHAIIRMEGTYLLGFGPRTAAAARDLAKALYGARPAN